MSEDGASAEGAPRHTDSRGLLIKGLLGAAQSVIPLAAMAYSSGAFVWGVVMIVPTFAAIIGFSVFFAWIRWRHLTYVTGPEDIRVEQGIFSRSARSVPYERIQDVSLEQKFLPRLFGLAEVRFETGAGGKDEISLTYLSLEEGERLRELVRERRDEAVPVAAPVAGATESEPAIPQSDTLFAMDNRRVLTFGLFEFSLVVFAVLLGAASQFDFLLPYPFWEFADWYRLLDGEGHTFSAMGRSGAVYAVASGIAVVLVLGVLSGVVITVNREYGFRVERTVKGFRRRRGLFNTSDVTLPVHRVQAAIVGTKIVRRRFGWHSLGFVTLAQDASEKSSKDYAIAPFARLEEIWPLLRASGIAPPSEDAAWHYPSPKPWIDDTILHGVFFTVVALIAWAVTRHPLALVAGALLVAGTMAVNYFGWRKRCHALDGSALLTRKGTFTPQLVLAPKLKLQSAEIVQSPLARWRGYSTLHLGLAGGTLSLQGLPLEEARAIRREIVETIAAVDFADLPR